MHQSVGEDTTRVIGRVDYDSETDRCVDFVVPVNGLPISDSFLATVHHFLLLKICSTMEQLQNMHMFTWHSL